jgi:hypothetical protein
MPIRMRRKTWTSRVPIMPQRIQTRRLFKVSTAAEAKDDGAKDELSKDQIWTHGQASDAEAGDEVKPTSDTN